MRLIRDLSAVPHATQGSILALGNFDGLHRGHRALLEHTLAQARALGGPAAILSFHPHPREFFAPNTRKHRLLSMKEKCRALEQMGFDVLFLLRFNATLASQTAQTFIENILLHQLQARHLITGTDFHFGRDRTGSPHLFAAYADRCSYETIAPICDDVGVISSTRIREALATGNLTMAAQLLGRPVMLCGHVVHGDKRGRTLGFPTANLHMSHLFLPRAGVYAVHSSLGAGVANIGIRPTVSGDEPRAEIHFFTPQPPLYGQYVRVELRAFLRDEQRFESLDALRAQIIQDCQQAKAL